jgi:NTE family protein
MHLIEAEDVIRELAGSSKMNGTWKFLTYLFELGRERCDKWLAENYDSIGAKGTVDLQARYL